MLPKWFERAKGVTPFWTEERCFINEILNSASSPEASLAMARVEAGVTTQLHRLEGVCERYVVHKGEGVIEIDGVRQAMREGDVAIIPAGAAQRITNTGQDALEFYCLCTPRFRPDSYVNLER